MVGFASLVAVAVLLLTGAAAADPEACTVHSPVEGSGLGEPVLLNFGPDSTITNVFVLVREGLLRPWVAGIFALDVTITSVGHRKFRLRFRSDPSMRRYDKFHWGAPRRARSNRTLVESGIETWSLRSSRGGAVARS